VQRIYQQQIGHLRQTMQRYVAGDTPEQPVRAFYPFVRVQTSTNARADSKLAYGFVEGPGRYETTLTRPDLFANYYLEQFRLLRRSHGVELEVGTSSQPIPIHFSFAEHDHVEGQLSAQRRLLMRDLFDLPDLTAMDDGIANGTWQPRPGDAQPLSLFTAPRVDYSLHRLRHYTGTQPEWFQNFVLFTNYQFYIDEFVRLGHAEMAKPDSEYIAFIEPGNVVTRRVGLSAEAGDELGVAPPRLPQMPAYHLVRKDASGITMVNIGVGPANAKTITDHIAVLRPHAWMMLGHCAGLRNTQQLGDYVLAHAYVREDHVLDEELPLWVPIPALSEIQLALEQAVADVTCMGRDELKRIMRTGTVASTDNRNWETAARQPAPAALFPEPRGGAGHGKRHHRRQRLSLSRALRHPAVRERQAAARRDQTARHGQPLLPRARGPASAHRHAGHRHPARWRCSAPAQPQAAQFC
jgi:AMP nucleosidase